MSQPATRRDRKGDPASTAMKLVIYGDFNCPYSCLASARADGLLDRGLAGVEWRAVEHDPDIAVPSGVVDDDLAAMLDREIAEVRGLVRPAEAFPIVPPPVRPNTAAAVAAFADARPADTDRLRWRLFTALWFDGRDIGDHGLVADLAGQTSDPAVPLVTLWRDTWYGLERPMVPMLVLPDGYVSRGLGALARLADFAGDGAGDGAAPGAVSR